MTTAITRDFTDSVVPVRPHRRTPGSSVRPADRRAVTPRPAGTRCARTPSHATVTRPASVYRRRRSVAGILVGAALGATVWFFAIVGGDYQDAMTPSVSSTSVVHARAGDSLSSIAGRVAPEMPTESVVADIVGLNDLSTASVRVGQALVIPVYR